MFVWCFILIHLLMMDCFQLANSREIKISPNPNRPSSLYRAPSHYRSPYNRAHSLPQSFIITSRPLVFGGGHNSASRPTALGHTIKSKTAAAPTRVSLFSYVPGVASLSCKGSSCGHSSDATDGTANEELDFPGEAIPIEPSDEYMTVTVGGAQASRPIIVTNGIVQPIRFPRPPQIPNEPLPNRIKSSSTSLVNLMTDRPYLQRGPSRRTRSTTSTTKISQFFRLSTTRRPSTTVRRRTRRTTSSTTSRPNVAADSPPPPPAAAANQRPPSLFIPAITAFTLMALPVAAAAVPFIIQGGKRRRRNVESFEDRWTINEDLMDILRDINQFMNSNDVARKVTNEHVLKSVDKVQKVINSSYKQITMKK